MEELIQKMIYQKLLTAGTGATISDSPPPQPEGQPNSAFPYIVFGLDAGRSWDTDDELGKDVDIYFHLWSRYKGTLEMRRMMDHIYSAFHRGNLSINGLHVVDCLFSYSSQYLDPDGRTRHGICRYRLTVQEE